MSEPWLVIHNGHRAWAQRALMLGDFSPTWRVPASWYVVDTEGKWADPYGGPPKCETCGLVPPLDQLEAVEVATGDRGFLARCRMLGRWPKATDSKTCWACNCPGLEMESTLLCKGCTAFLRGDKTTRVTQPAPHVTRRQALATALFVEQERVRKLEAERKAQSEAVLLQSARTYEQHAAREHVLEVERLEAAVLSEGEK